MGYLAGLRLNVLDLQKYRGGKHYSCKHSLYSRHAVQIQSLFRCSRHFGEKGKMEGRRGKQGTDIK